MSKGFCNEGMTNAEYLEDWKLDAWYPVLVETDKLLELAMPGYEISQIKEKFRGLRYYFTVPPGTSNEAVEIAQQIVYAAERDCAIIDGEVFD